MHFDRRQLLVGAGLVLASAYAPRVFAQERTAPFSLDPLPYQPNALEPHIDARTMELHHGRHHRSYVDNLNNALKDHGELSKKPLHEILANLDSVPENIRRTVRNNGGGHANHTMFWQVMGPQGGKPSDALRQAIERDLGGMEKMQERVNSAGQGQFGSGWVFVTVDKEGKLEVTTRPNQDTPLMDGQRVLFGNDVWEHAYYLKYQNQRGEYLKAWWNVVDWNRISERYGMAREGKLTI
jgi:superoxide dismutase, Fe-Mn family